MLPFVFAEALSKLKYTIFSWEWNCILKCSSGLIKQSGRNTVDCCIHLETEEQSHLFQTWNRNGRGNACPREGVRFLCRLPSCPMQLRPTVPAVDPIFLDESVHLWEDLSLKSFSLLLFWAQVLQKHVCLLRSSMVVKSL